MIPLPNISLRTWGLISAGLLIAVLFAMLQIRTGERNRAVEQAAATQAAFDQTVASYRAARDQARRDDELNTMRVGKQQAAISKDVTDEYTQRIADLRADFAERVRAAQARANPGSGGSPAVPGVASPAGRADEAPRDPGLPSRQALIASEQAEQLVALQAWVKRQSAVDVNGVTTRPE